MSETLCAVIIGGAIAVSGGVVTTILSLFVNGRRWKKDKKLEHLYAERKHLRELYSNVLIKLADCIKSEGDWDWDIVTRLCLVLPDDKNMVSVLQKMVNPTISRQEMKEEYKQIELAMRKSLAEVNKKINKLMS